MAWASRTVSAERFSVAVGGDVTNSPINIVNGIPHEQAADFVRLAVSGRPRDYTELLRRLDALIPAESHLRAEALARFFAILGEAEVSPQDLTNRLAEIAGHYQALLARLETTSSTDPEVQRLKAEARQALEDTGDFARAEELLNQAKARDLLVIEQMRATIERVQAALDARKLSAAEAAAENGALMMTQLRYADAARYCAEAVELTPETHADELSDRLRAWTEAAWRAGDFPTGVAAAGRALALDQGRLPADDALLAEDLINLAGLYRATGRYQEAEPLYERALAIGEKTLGPEHPDLATQLNNLALLYHDTCRYAEAEPLLERAIAIDEKVHGPDHPDLATGLNNLAQIYHDTGRYAEAEPLFRRVLAIFERALGPEHPNVATAANNLAGLYHDTGRYAEAEPLLERAIAIDEKTLGPEHPDLATRLNNLAGLCRATGRSQEAEPLYERALAIGEKALGPEHPDLATRLNNLAGLCRATGRSQEAEPLYERALAIIEKSLPPDHPHLMVGLENYAGLLDELGRGEEAAALRARAEAIRQRRERPPSSPSH